MKSQNRVAKTSQVRKTEKQGPPPYDMVLGRAALVFDIFLPFYPRRRRRVQKILNDLFTNAEIVKSGWLGSVTDMEQKRRLERIVLTLQGYSITEVNGRFRKESNVNDDKVQQVRIIVDLDRNALSRSKEDRDLLNEAAIVFRGYMWSIMYGLVVRPYAASVNPEMEFWMLESGPAMIHKWVRADYER
jgi:hypothetical protein